MAVFYNLFVQLFPIFIRVASLWNPKARRWINGRKNQFERLSLAVASNNKPIVWFHSASLGEFEQGRPVIEAIKNKYPHYRILLTFFSPSGFEVRKNYAGADMVYYLPMDSKKNANRFLEITQPKLAFFIKYETWYHYLEGLKQRQIPRILISGILLEKQFSFRPWGEFMKKIYASFTHIFAQSDGVLTLLKENKIATSYSYGGDTRFDRVHELSLQDFQHKSLSTFTAEGPILVAGSTWKEDEEMIAILLETEPNIKLILAPHEVDNKHIAHLQKLFSKSILFTEIEQTQQKQDYQVVIIDCIGLLSKLYRYATVCYVGGGFNRAGIHNILEAAAYGKTVWFGPNYEKANEAKEMLEKKLAFSFQTKDELLDFAKQQINDQHLAEKNAASFAYVKENTGATKRILDFLEDRNLL